jgi:WD40 repeat protein
MLTVTDTKWDWSPTTARGFRSIGFTEDARWCFAASVDGNLTVWSIEGGSPEAVVTYRLGKAPVGDVSGYLTQDARYFLALVGPDELKILDLRRVRTGETKPIVLKRKVYRSGVSVADSWLAATTGPGEFMLVDLRGQEPQVLDIHLSPVVRLWPQLGEFEVVFAPSGNAVTVRQNEGECFVFRLPPTKNDITPAFEWHDLDLAHEKMWAVFSQDDAWVAIGSDGGSLWLCSLSDATGVLCQVALDARRSTLRVSGAAFSPDSVHIAATTTAGSISVWRPGDTPSFERSVAQHRAPPTIEFSKDGRKMLTYDASLVYFGNTGEKLERLPDQPSEIQSAAVTESGEVVIILGVRHISWERRSYYWWGIPIVNLGWF